MNTQSSHRLKYSAERLRSLYTRLLQHIDAADDSDYDVNPRRNTGHWSRYLPTARLRSNDSIEDVSERELLKQKELLEAFRYIASHASSDHHDSCEGEAARRNVSIRAIKTARKVEDSVIKILRDIGEVVVNAEQPTEQRTSLRDDETFAYFCEKAMLVLLVEIVSSQPGGATSTSIESKDPLQGVVWSPKVKAQVLYTVSVLIAGVRDTSALYFLLSQNCVNQLVVMGLDLLVGGTQWTVDSAAVEEILSAYTDLLKTLTLHLCGSPELFPLYLLPNDAVSNKQKPLFPLFSATVHITTSSYAQSDSYIHATCLNLLVGLLGISDPAVRHWICHAEPEHQLLCHHICQQFIERYRRITNLVTGPVVDPVRCVSIGAQLLALDGQLAAINDLFSCHVNVFGLRLCEQLLTRCIRLLVHDVVPTRSRKFLVVGVSDQDVIPSPEAAAQAASLILARMLVKLHYPPFIRMVAVALFHVRMPHTWESSTVEGATNETEFVCMSLLNKLVSQQPTEDDNSSSTTTNLFREELLKSLSCDYGEWRFISAAAIVENALLYVDVETLAQLDILPVVCDTRYTASGIERALVSFLARNHNHPSSLSTMALECASSLAIQYTYTSTCHIADGGKSRAHTYQRESPLLKQLHAIKSLMFEKALESQKTFPVTDMVVDLVETFVKTRYKRGPASGGRRAAFAFRLSHHATRAYALGPEALTRKLRGVDWNDVEAMRFYVQMAIYCRAVCRVVDRWYASVSTASDVPAHVELDDEAKELQTIFSSLTDRPTIGTDLDLHGRMAFAFTFHVNPSDSNSTRHRDTQEHGRMRTLSDDMIFRESSDFVLVLDPTDVWIVKPYARNETKRGTILCGIPLLDVVAAATDESRLHVAVHHDNVGFLIQNGNMVLTFESSGTSLIVCRYLEKCRSLLRHELYRKIVQFFTAEATATDDMSLQDEGLPQVHTY